MAHTSVTGYDAGGQQYQNAGLPKAATDAVPQGYLAYDFGNIGSSGKPDAGVTWLDFLIVRKLSLALNLAGSLAVANTAPTADATFTITQNATAIGTLKFAAGSKTGVFTSTAAVTLAVGDRLQVTTPGTQDSTLAGVTITLAASRAI
jgi:hypothetical protein